MNELSLKGIAASEGIAIGPAFRYQPVDLTIHQRKAGSPQQEFSLFEKAASIARKEIAAIYEDLSRRTGPEHAAIFEGHLLILEDPMLGDAIAERLKSGETAEIALSGATDEIAAMFASMDDEMFAARALDVRDVGRRVLRIMLGVQDTSLASINEPSIIVANDLTPSDTAGLDPELTLGLVTAVGGLTSHTAILARTFGIPALVGVGEKALASVADGDHVILDALDGELIISPSLSKLNAAREKQASFTQKTHAIMSYATMEAVTADSMHVEIGANIGDVESAASAVEMGASGVGLLRTEFLYLNDTRNPSEEKQLAAYKAIFTVMGDRPIIVRTLDIGGDKPPSYMAFPEEMNPFLGWRAIRICMDDITLFKTQLRAIMRAAVGHNVLIMFPMISGLEELRFARNVCQEVQAELKAERLPFNDRIPLGIMVETPGAAMMADALADECDFFSIGTNDLTQYTLAVDRGNDKISYLYQPLHPAVLRLIKHVIDTAHAHGKWVGMCGELAGMQKAIPVLLGFGLDEFSMVPRAIPEAKYLLSKLTLADTQALAAKVLQLGTTEEVESLMAAFLSKYA